MSGREPARILLVDDRPENLLSLAATLEHPDYEFVEARSGREALRRLLEDDFAAILLDVQMPEMDGFETATLIRARERNRDTPILFVSAISKTDLHVARGYSVGAIDYVFKPFAPEVLRAKVAAFVELWRKTRALQEEIRQREQAEAEVRRLNEHLEARVRERTAELAAANRRLEGEIEEHRRTEAALARARDAAETAARARSRFVAGISHELRTPLNAVLGFSQILADETFGPLNERQRQHVDRVLEGAGELLRQIDDLLQLARMDAGPETMVLARFAPAPVLEDAAARVRALAEAREIALSLAVDGTPPEVTGDPDRFRQIMDNLLDNALKFTPPGGAVRVEAAAAGGDPEPGWLRVTVRDTGIGVRAEDCDRIFNEFEQVDASYSRERGGVGLGLALARRLVELHGGRIWVESEGEGQGSAFSFLLPVRQPVGDTLPGPAPLQEESHGPCS